MPPPPPTPNPSQPVCCYIGETVRVKSLSRDEDIGADTEQHTTPCDAIQTDAEEVQR